MVQEMLDTGASILVDMSGQRERLKVRPAPPVPVCADLATLCHLPTEQLLRIQSSYKYRAVACIFSGSQVLLLALCIAWGCLY